MNLVGPGAGKEHDGLPVSDYFNLIGNLHDVVGI